MIKRPISSEDKWIVDKDNLVLGVAPAGTGEETTLVTATTDPVTGTKLYSGSSLVGVSSVTLAEMIALTPALGLIVQVTDLPGNPLFESDGTLWRQVSINSIYGSDSPYIPFGSSSSELLMPAGVAFKEQGIATYGTVASKLINFSGALNLGVADFGLGAFPAGATAMEIWSPSGHAIAWQPQTSANLTISVDATDANFLLPAVSAGVRFPRAIIPLGGALTAASPRFAAKVPGAGCYLNARLIGETQKYVHAGGAGSDLLTGANASIQLNYVTASAYPVTTSAVLLQLNGGTYCTWTTDGTAPSLTKGQYIAAGEMRLIDLTQCGFTLSQLRFYLAAGQFIRSIALARAY